jgi:uncharacterized protein with ACT and thioredoxin-like domain
MIQKLTGSKLMGGKGSTLCTKLKKKKNIVVINLGNIAPE